MRAAAMSAGRFDWFRPFALLALCAAYIQGGVAKLLDFQGAIAEQAHFGFHPPALFTAAVIVTELVGSALVVSGLLRWLGALWLAGFTLAASLTANAFWALPPGTPEHFAAINCFFEHLGLIGGFLLAAITDRRAP